MSSLFQQKNWHQVLIEFSIENLNSYVLKMEEFLEKELERFNEEFEKKTRGWNEEDKDEYGEHLSDEYWILAETHPNFLRSSMFVSIYSFFEKELKDLCKFYKKSKNNNQLSSPQKMSKIAKALLCLGNCHNVSFSKEIKEWEKIDGVYREIRNIIAHDGGEIEINRLEEYTSLFEGIPMKIKSSTGELLPQAELCLSFLMDITNFFNKFFELIDKNNH
ncbi:hypothetical protein IIM_00494 [Bacillus cereus VD107]|nr:hypothetical protein IIM_00494 [Bacillus cereus VD107]